MPLYTYKCPRCEKTIEVLVRGFEKEQYCVCTEELAKAAIATRMERTLGTPAAPQWNCRTAHSRSKGF